MGELLTGGAGPRVGALAVSGIGPCLLPADAFGRPLRRGILYGIDSRARGQITQLNAELGAAEIRRVGGSILTSQAVGPKLLWLRQSEPDIYRQTRQLLSCSSFLVGRLTGSYVLDHHSASQFTPMYDLVRQCWHDDWCDHIASGLPLPPAVCAGHGLFPVGCGTVP